MTDAGDLLSFESGAYLWLMLAFVGMLIDIETMKVLTLAVFAVAFAVLSVNERLGDMSA